MTRGQRRWHRTFWLVVGPALLAVVLWSVLAGQEYPAQSRPAGAVGEPGR